MSYEVDFDTFSELVNKIFKNAKLAKTDVNKSANTEVHDSSLLPDNITIKEKKAAEKDKKKQEPTPNKEAIPTDD
jgi:hypothetical protein